MELHGRLLKGLLERAALTGLDGEGAWLLTPNGKRNRAHRRHERPALPSGSPGAVARNKSEEVHVVVAGGGDEAGRSLRAAWPFWQLTRRFGFHHVYGEGMYERVKGARLPLIASVAERVRSLEPPTSEEMAQYAASVALAAKEQDDFAQAVKGHPWVTYGIAALCVALFALEELWGDSSSRWRSCAWGRTLGARRCGRPGRCSRRRSCTSA
jgi:hypothetical protein